MNDQPIIADEVVVTREMMEAGAEKLMEFALPDFGRAEYEEAAKAAFQVMAEVMVRSLVPRGRTCS